MTKKKELTHEEKIEKALSELPFPITDEKHRIKIFCVNDKARSNQTRFEHISVEFHELTVRDIERIPKQINVSELKMDHSKKDTFNLYIKRNSFSKEYIKIGLELNFKESNEAKIRTIFITKNKN